MFSPISGRGWSAAGIASVPDISLGNDAVRQLLLHDFDYVVEEIECDWYDASKLYANWARSQSWASAPPASAYQSPSKEREVVVWEQASINDGYPFGRIVDINKLTPDEWLSMMLHLWEARIFIFGCIVGIRQVTRIRLPDS